MIFCTRQDNCMPNMVYSHQWRRQGGDVLGLVRSTRVGLQPFNPPIRH